MATGKGATLLADFTPEVEGAEEYRASQVGKEHKKASKQASSLAETLEAMESEEEAREMLTALVERLTNKVEEDAPDFTKGIALADQVSKVLGLEDDYRPAGFDPEEGADLLNRWKSATGNRGGTRAEGDKAQRTPCPIKVTFDIPEGVETGLSNVIEHNYWSSVTNEMQKRIKAVEGLDKVTRPTETGKAWRAIADAIKEGNRGSVGTFTWPTSKGDVSMKVEAL